MYSFFIPSERLRRRFRRRGKHEPHGWRGEHESNELEISSRLEKEFDLWQRQEEDRARPQEARHGRKPTRQRQILKRICETAATAAAAAKTPSNASSTATTPGGGEQQKSADRQPTCCGQQEYGFGSHAGEGSSF